MLNKTFIRTAAAIVTSATLAFSGGVFAADTLTTQVPKSASVPKGKKPAKVTGKPKSAQIKKKIHRVEDAPDFRAAFVPGSGLRM